MQKSDTKPKILNLEAFSDDFDGKFIHIRELVDPRIFLLELLRKYSHGWHF